MSYRLADGSLSTEYSVGDKFVYKEGVCSDRKAHAFSGYEGVLVLTRDDASSCPRFKAKGGEEWGYEEWSLLVPYKEEGESKPVVKVGDKFRVTVDMLYCADVRVGDVLEVGRLRPEFGDFVTKGSSWVFNFNHIGNGLEPITESKQDEKEDDVSEQTKEEITFNHKWEIIKWMEENEGEYLYCGEGEVLGHYEDGEFCYKGYNDLNPDHLDTSETYYFLKELEWYEHIPDGGVLCWVSDTHKEPNKEEQEAVDVIIGCDTACSLVFRGQQYHSWRYATPVKPEDLLNEGS